MMSFQCFNWMKQQHEWGDPTVTYWWTGWVWKKKEKEKKKTLVHIQDFEEISDPFRGIYWIFLNLIKNTERCQHVANWSWKHYELDVLCQKNSPDIAWSNTLRATSHTRLKAHDHCNLRVLIGRKGGDRSYSLHTQRWKPKGPRKTSWMKSLHGGLWIRFHGLLEFTSCLPPRGGPDANFGRPWFF